VVQLLDPVNNLDIWRANEPTDLPPIGRWNRRLREYPVNFGYFLRDPQARVTQAGVEVIATFDPSARITQAGVEVIYALRPTGAQLSGNPPAGRLRARDYTLAEAPSIPLSVYIQPPVTGDTTVASTALPPKAAARAVDYTWFNPLLPNLAGQDALLPDHSTDATALPTPAAPRSRDYSYTASYFQGLIGQDTVPPGEQLSGNAPPGPLRASALTDPGANYVIYLTAPPPPHPVGLTTGYTELAPRAPARAVDYTWLRSLPIHLIGQDRFNPGVQVFDLPPRGPLRSRDYTWVYTLPGQFPPPAPPLPPGAQSSALQFMRPVLRVRGEYPHNQRAPLPLLTTPPVSSEQFQAVLII
jgi:hypothetical protein